MFVWQEKFCDFVLRNSNKPVKRRDIKYMLEQNLSPPSVGHEDRGD